MNWLRCTECRHEFSPEDQRQEDPHAWGHPCHQTSGRPMACESFREPCLPVEDLVATDEGMPEPDDQLGLL